MEHRLADERRLALALQRQLRNASQQRAQLLEQLQRQLAKSGRLRRSFVAAVYAPVRGSRRPAGGCLRCLGHVQQRRVEGGANLGHIVAARLRCAQQRQLRLRQHAARARARSRQEQGPSEQRRNLEAPCNRQRVRLFCFVVCAAAEAIGKLSRRNPSCEECFEASTPFKAHRATIYALHSRHDSGDQMNDRHV
eukprot:770122-Pleurochrysis_carterae.AAC.2